MLTKAKMRAALTVAVLVTFGLSGSTDALCFLKNENTATCHKVKDLELIDSYNLTTLKTSVYQKILGSTSLKDLSANLENLDLSEGDIQIVESGTFSKLIGLRDLKLSDNSIAQLKESALDGLEKLKNLDLRRNDIRQLPLALTKLTALKNLEISGNPLICNCPSLRVRDDLLANGVKISKKVFCSGPPNLKGVSLLVPESEVICMFEEQDKEMQADEADAGSGDLEDGVDVPTEVPLVPAHISDETDHKLEIITDDLVVPTLGRSGLGSLEPPTGASTEATSDSSGSSASSVDENSLTDSDDFVFPSARDNAEDDLIVEGSGATNPDEEGSGAEGSGTDDIWKSVEPKVIATDPVEKVETTTSTTEQPTISTMSWFDVLFGAVESTTESDKEESEIGDPANEQFITVKPEETVTTTTTTTANPSIISKGGIIPKIDVPGVTEETVVTKKVNDLDTGNPDVTKSGKFVEDSTNGGNDDSINKVGEASTSGSQKSMGSYIVLAALLGVLGALVVFAAYRSGFCRKKPSRDVERGSELKDVKKSLLDGSSSNQPKISSNGNMENVPLVAPATDPWNGPQEARQWQSQSNGAKHSPNVESDPVKPPRKSLPPQEDTNGLQEVKTHAPLSTFASTTNGSQGNSVTPPNSPSSVSDDGKRSPPLSPNAQRVKITLQENPDSVPKTPILITRTKPGVNLVKTP